MWPYKKIKVITVIKIGRKVNAIKVIVNRFFKFIFTRDTLTPHKPINAKKRVEHFSTLI